MKHTPGQWEYGCEVEYGRDIRCGDIWVGTANGPHDGNEGFPSSEECEANARLIAAAPDMYEALLTVMSYWHKDQYEAVVKAAIAKAEGRQP
jgi:hypothetical protein